MQRITQDRLKELFFYDADTGEFTRRIDVGRWRAGDLAGSVNSNGYLLVVVDGVRYRAHRLVWLYVNGVMPGEGIDVDHANRIRSDNRIRNLRLATRSENQQNRAPQSNNASGVLGAAFIRSKGKWRASICLKGKRYFLGWFDSADDAGQSYELAKQALHKFHPQVA